MSANNKKAVRLTPERIRRFKCPVGLSESLLWDSISHGLAVRIRQSGRMMFIYQGRYQGRTFKMTIGHVPTPETELGAAIGKARDTADNLRLLVSQGKDPRLERKIQERKTNEKRQESEKADRELEASKQMVGDIWDLYVEARKSRKKNPWSVLHIADHRKVMQSPGQPRKRSNKKTTAGVLFPLKLVQLRDLSPELIQSIIEKEADKRPTTTARAYRLLKAFLRWVEARPQYKGVLESERLLNDDVQEQVPTVGARENDCLEREMLATWFAAVRSIQNPVIAAYLQGLVITGARREELAGLKWDDVDFKWRSMIIHDKTRGTRTIPLTPYLSNLFSALPRRNEWVFSSPGAKNGRIIDPSIAHRKALQTSGLPHVSLHGLRRSFSTLSEWIEVPTGIVYQIEGRAPNSTAEKHYKRRPLDLLRLWHDRIEAWILDEAGIKQPENSEGGIRLVEN